MGRHRLKELPVTERRPKSRDHRSDIGGSAVGGAAHNRRHHRQPGVDEDVAHWRGLKEEVRHSQERAAELKRIFVDGLTGLVRGRVLHPQMLNCLPDVHMIKLMDEVDEENFGGKHVHGFMSSGWQSTDNRQTQGRYLAVETFDDVSTNIHELMHVGVRIGQKEQYHVLREPITNKLAKGVMHAQGMDPSELNRYYGPHERLLEQVMDASGLNYWDISYFVSGDDPVQNDYLLRTAVWERTGWDMVGFMQNEYVNSINDAESNPNQDAYIAARSTQVALDEQLAAMRQAQYA